MMRAPVVTHQRKIHKRKYRDASCDRARKPSLLSAAFEYFTDNELPVWPEIDQLAASSDTDNESDELPAIVGADTDDDTSDSDATDDESDDDELPCLVTIRRDETVAFKQPKRSRSCIDTTEESESEMKKSKLVSTLRDFQVCRITYVYDCEGLFHDNIFQLNSPCLNSSVKIECQKKLSRECLN